MGGRHRMPWYQSLMFSLAMQLNWSRHGDIRLKPSIQEAQMGRDAELDTVAEY